MTPSHFQQTLSDYLRVFPAEAPEQARFKLFLSSNGDLLSRQNMQGHINSSALVLNSQHNAVLCMHHKALDMWLPNPGGHYEAPGDMWESAQREVAEETGVAGIILHEWHQAHPVPFDIHTHAIPARPSKGETAHEHHDFLYLAVAPASAKLNAQEEEVGGLKWMPLNELPKLGGLRNRDRIAPKLRQLGLL